MRCDSWVMSAVWHTEPAQGRRRAWLLLDTRNLQFQCKGVVSGSKMLCSLLAYAAKSPSQAKLVFTGPSGWPRSTGPPFPPTET